MKVILLSKIPQVSRKHLPDSWWASCARVFGQGGTAKRLYPLARPPCLSLSQCRGQARVEAETLLVKHAIQCAEAIRRVARDYPLKYRHAVNGHGLKYWQEHHERGSLEKYCPDKIRSIKLLLPPNKFRQMGTRQIASNLAYAKQLNKSITTRLLMRVTGLSEMCRSLEVRGNHWQH